MKEPKLLRELDFREVLNSGKLYPSYFQGTSKRLKIFKAIGHCCVVCKKSATHLRKFQRPGDKQIFWSIATDDGIEMTIDHVKPKSLGGKNSLDNYQPMCYLCNQDKGNTMNLVRFLDHKDKENLSGLEIWVKVKGKFVFKGVFDRIDRNPYSGDLEIFTVSERGSSYKMNKNAYIKIPPETDN